MVLNHTQQNNIQLALDIRRGQWLLYDAEALVPLAIQFLSHSQVNIEPISFNVSTYAESSNHISISSDKPIEQDRLVAVIPMLGTLTKYNSCGTIGATTIANAILNAAYNDNVIGMVLDIDSGGGACNAVPVVIEAINKFKSFGKPIVAHTDLCASAAYWIASQCDAIFSDNSLSRAGSIGVLTNLIDDSNTSTGAKVISVYARESTDKNLSYRNALHGDYELLQTEMSDIITEFHSAVKNGRKYLVSDAAGVLSGADFTPQKAIEVGLIDGLYTLEETIKNVFARANYI